MRGALTIKLRERRPLNEYSGNWDGAGRIATKFKLDIGHGHVCRN